MPTIDDPAELRARVDAAPVARLATLRADGTPRLVPITFAPVDGLVCSAVDDVKPKRGSRLARLADLARDPRVGLLVDHYAEDWSTLWWVRVDGTAEVLHPDDPCGTAAGCPGRATLRERALDALAAKYPAYHTNRPAGPLLVITALRWSGWSAR